MSDVRQPGIPDDLVSIGEAARELDMTYQKLRYHVDRQGFARWQRGANKLVSLGEVRAYIERLYEVRPIERNSQDGGGRDDEETKREA